MDIPALCDLVKWVILILFILQVIKLHEEFFLPGEVIMEPGNVVDQLYFVCHGGLVWFNNLESAIKFEN